MVLRMKKKNKIIWRVHYIQYIIILLHVFILCGSCKSDESTKQLTQKGIDVEMDKSIEFIEAKDYILSVDDVKVQDSMFKDLSLIEVVFKRYRHYLKQLTTQSNHENLLKQWVSEQKIVLRNLGKFNLDNSMLPYVDKHSVTRQLKLIDSVELAIYKEMIPVSPL